VFLDENVCIGFLSSIKMGEGVGEVSFIIITTSNHTLLLHDSLLLTPVLQTFKGLRQLSGIGIIVIP
jgi:hypothetical protein